MNFGKKLLKAFAIYTPLILLAIESIIVAVLLFQENIDYLTIMKFLIGMGIEIIWFLIGKNIDDDSTHLKFQKELDNFSNNIKVFNNASIEILNTYDDFYSKLTKSRQSAKNKVLLTQLDPWPPSNYGDEGTREAYFDGDVSYFKTHPNVNVYRILSIETEEKLKWVQSLIESTKDLPNLFLAYINIDKIENSVPFPKLLSLQIIDNEEVFFLNPQYSYMPRAYKTCYYIKNKDISEIYVSYYEKIWTVLSEKNDHGCILKDGKDIEGYEAKLNAIKASRGW